MGDSPRGEAKPDVATRRAGYRMDSLTHPGPAATRIRRGPAGACREGRSGAHGHRRTAPRRRSKPGPRPDPHPDHRRPGRPGQPRSRSAPWKPRPPTPRSPTRQKEDRARENQFRLEVAAAQEDPNSYAPGNPSRSIRSSRSRSPSSARACSSSAARSRASTSFADDQRDRLPRRPGPHRHPHRADQRRAREPDGEGRLANPGLRRPFPLPHRPVGSDPSQRRRQSRQRRPRGLGDCRRKRPPTRRSIDAARGPRSQVPGSLLRRRLHQRTPPDRRRVPPYRKQAALPPLDGYHQPRLRPVPAGTGQERHPNGDPPGIQGRLATELPDAENNYSSRPAGPARTHKVFRWPRTPRFQSFLGFFDAEVAGNDTLNPLQREFIKLAQILKSRLVTELEYNSVQGARADRGPARRLSESCRIRRLARTKPRRPWPPPARPRGKSAPRSSPSSTPSPSSSATTTRTSGTSRMRSTRPCRPSITWLCVPTIIET